MARKSGVSFYQSKNGYYTHIGGKTMRLADGPRSPTQYTLACKKFKDISSKTVSSGVKKVTTGYPLIYVVQVVPDLHPGRIKIGQTTNIHKRLQQYKALSPTCVVLKTWACSEESLITLEKQGMNLLLESDAIGLGGEVFDCKNVNEVIQSLDRLFV